MSFSSDLKKELSKVTCADMYECAAEIAAYIIFDGEICQETGVPVVHFHSDNSLMERRLADLTSKIGITVCENNQPHTCSVVGETQNMMLLKYCGFMDNLGRILEKEEYSDSSLLQKNSCQRAFLRGAFLASGSITDPNKNYHFEINCENESIAYMLRSQMEFFGLEAKIVLRKKNYVVYMKEGSMISEVLAVMGGNISMLNFENVRVLKDVRNDVNRRVNCETANITKTVSAARKQIEDIEYVVSKIGLKKLAPPLREIACVRLDDPSATLKELGEKLDPPVGKSGVNHRLRKLSQMAQELRERERL